VIDQPSRRVVWNQLGDGTWDATYLSFFWLANDEKVTTAGQWRVIAPPGTDELVLPPIPDAYRDWLPADIESIADAYVILFDSDALEWDEARQLGLDPSVSFDHAETLSTPTTLRYSSSFFD
jgi:hypothetical protein